MAETDNRVKFTYTNWRGETAERAVVPSSIEFGATEYHSEPQWLLKAWDLDKQAVRDFAMKDISNWRPYE
jgi:predicted DNA-binding transcriptional regulator YafY